MLLAGIARLLPVLLDGDVALAPSFELHKSPSMHPERLARFQAFIGTPTHYNSPYPRRVSTQAAGTCKENCAVSEFVRHLPAPKEADSPFAFAVKVNAINLPLHLVETYVIEPFKTRTAYRPYSMVRHQEVLFPAHKNMLALCNVFEDDRGASASLFGVRAEGRKFGPVGQVGLVVGAPAFVLGHEAVLVADDFSLEISSQGWMVVG